MTKAHTLYDFIWMIRPLVAQIEEAAALGLQGTGLSVRKRAILEILARDGSQSVPALAQTLQIKRQYVQLLVNEVILAGLAEKRPNPRHRRSPLIVLTKAGGELIQDVMAQEMEIVARIADRLEGVDIDTAFSVAQHVLSGFRQFNGAGNTQPLLR